MPKRRNIAHICPDGKSICRDSATCCPIGAGIYGCCPMKDAVCCDDHTHCCPPATKCDMNEISVLEKNKEMEHLTEEVRISKSKQLLKIYSGRNNSCSKTSHTCCVEEEKSCVGEENTFFISKFWTRTFIP
uniref:GRANULINS domain-containing protein n=1 Tax=Onchocerca volvulus TaxID=6282 RepID=A0A8R1TYR2_ONCVO